MGSWIISVRMQIPLILLHCFHAAKSDHEVQAVEKIFSQCKKKSPEFDTCILRAFNQLQPYFKTGIPEIGIAPFDPHFAAEVKQERKIFGIGYSLILRNVYERGWTQSTVTKYRTDWENATIIYSQFFPDKMIEAQYEFKSDVLGPALARSGRLSLVLRNYSQTTRVARRGGGGDGGAGRVRVRVRADRIGDMELHITNLLNDRSTLERWLDDAINALWKPGFAVLRRAIDDLVSAAFTDIWSTSFTNFHIERFIKD